MSSLYILEIKPLSEESLVNILSHIFGSLFILLILFFSCAEAFYFDEVPFVYSFLYIPRFRIHISENIAALNMRFSWLCSLELLWYHALYLSLSSILSLFFCMV